MKWQGASCICVHDGKLLMVLQGLPQEEKGGAFRLAEEKETKVLRHAVFVKCGKRRVMW